MPALTNEAVLATIPLTWTKIQKTPIFCTVGGQINWVTHNSENGCCFTFLVVTQLSEELAQIAGTLREAETRTIPTVCVDLRKNEY